MASPTAAPPPDPVPASSPGLVWLTEASLDTADWKKPLVHPRVGGISSFHGTTRDTFGDKTVLRLEYEAYAPMALREMELIRARVLSDWPDTIEALVWHRLGVVPIAETSVVIAVSAVHRRSALEAVAWAIDELKARVPIWKKEVYTDGSVWKANPEFAASHAGCGCGAVSSHREGAGSEEGRDQAREAEDLVVSNKAGCGS